MLIVTVTAGLGAGWWIDHKALAKAKERAEIKAGLLEAMLDPNRERCGTVEHLGPVSAL